MTRIWPRWLALSAGSFGLLFLVVGWLLVTGADGDFPKAIGEGGAVAALLAGALLVAKVLAPVLLRLIPDPGKRDSTHSDFRDGQTQQMLQNMNDSFHELTALLREIRDNQVKHHLTLASSLQQHDTHTHEVGRQILDSLAAWRKL